MLIQNDEQIQYITDNVWGVQVVQQAKLNWPANTIYKKQSYRNRAYILGPHQIEKLIIIKMKYSVICVTICLHCVSRIHASSCQGQDHSTKRSKTSTISDEEHRWSMERIASWNRVFGRFCLPSFTIEFERLV